MFMDEAREVLEQYSPGLNKYLSDLELTNVECMKPNDLANIIRQHQLPGLWVPQSLGGKGISPYDGIRIQRAIGARAPSMALMMTMHNFTISFCKCLLDVVPTCADMLRKTAQHNLLVASAFAEGRYGSGILDSTVYVVRESNGDYTINGSKKPCSMTHCADIITLGIAEKTSEGVKRTGMAIIPAQHPGITRHKFWNTKVLAAADSHELRFEDVRIAKDRVLLSSHNNPEMDLIVSKAEITGLCWFEIAATASYLGIVSGLAEKSLMNDKVNVHERARLGGELECAQAALDGAIRIMETADVEQSLLAKILFIRFSVQRQIEQSAMLGSELAGGLNFIRNDNMALLLSASRCLAFHPINRRASEIMLAEWLSGAAKAT